MKKINTSVHQFYGCDDVAAGRSPVSSASTLFPHLCRCESVLRRMSTACPSSVSSPPQAPPFHREKFAFSAHLFIFSVTWSLWAQCELSTRLRLVRALWGFKGRKRSASASFCPHLRRCCGASEDHATPQAVASSAPFNSAVSTGDLRQIR